MSSNICHYMYYIFQNDIDQKFKTMYNFESVSDAIMVIFAQTLSIIFSFGGGGGGGGGNGILAIKKKRTSAFSINNKV